MSDPTSDPVDGQQHTESTTTATPVTTSGTGLAPHVAAGLACVFSVLGGAVFLLLEKRDKFVRFWAMQALLLGLVWLAIGYILFPLAALLLGHLPLIGKLMIVLLWILALAFRIGWVVLY